jgi:transaldolase
MTRFESRINELLSKDLREEKIKAHKDPFWESLRAAGTALWLDTGDMNEAEANWTAEMSALTTNNTLLNNEVQKGIYDNFIYDAGILVKDLPPEEQVREVAFMLNARHGLRLASRFGGYVSVELHTDTAHDTEAIGYYGRRYHDINPEQFIVKVPYTPEGLLGARILRESGVKINFTLEFSARENVLVTRITRPDYLNVFLGRIGAFISSNNLGDGRGAGEMAVLSSQRWVTKLSQLNPWPTLLIAASLRNYEQLDLLAGTDVFTMPPKVAAAGHSNLKGSFRSRLMEQYPVDLNETAKDAGIEKCWAVDKRLLDLAGDLSEKVPQSGEELVDRARNAGFEDMFPVLTENEEALISQDGKIPVYSHWENKIRNGELAVDTLLTLAGLASFTADQEMLDGRIKDILGH